ncbi:hypothetical protein ACS8FD_00380 [Psychrobacter sp. 1U2]|uniref:hypothetical protein n=1 Tax=Psychrobacter sp. 1U2 TaxID=3453577 RepID=UPI003F44B5DF
MKSNTFNYSLLAVGVAALMGVSTGAMANTKPTESGAVSKGANGIKNIATAKYKVGNDAEFQPEVQSNEVIVNISETANFSLVATSDGVIDEKNEDIAATPNNTTEFKHTLANIGNVSDTYTINTTGENSDIVTKDPSYALDSASIDYTIQPIDGGTLSVEQSEALSTLGQAKSGTISSGGTIQLPPGLEAALSYQVATGNKTGGDIGVGTLTATSTFIAAAEPAKQKLTNENQTIVKVPVFKIDKSATCQGKTTDCNSFDLNADNQEITYSIKVTNVDPGYSTDADNVVFRDQLPEGMTLVPGSVKFGTATVADTNLTITKPNNRQTLQGTLPSLAVGEDITVSFKVSINKETLTEAGSATNHVTLYDNYDNSTPEPDNTNGFDISDSTDDTIDNPNLPNGVEGQGNIGEDTSSTITFTDRDLTISAGTTEEVPVQGEVTYSHIITNEGNENEGGTDRPITITLTDPVTGNALSIEEAEGKKPYYVAADGTNTPLTKNPNGTYKLPDSIILVPNTAADGQTPTAGSTVEIGYTVKSNGASDGEVGTTDNDIGLKETNSVTLIPAVVDGIDAPAKTVNNTTTIQGLKLEKLAAVVSATGIENLTCPTDTSGLTFGRGEGINAKPYDCIVYKITATNTFETKVLTTVTLSDEKALWNAQATYQDDVTGLIGTSTNGVVNNDTGDFITTTLGTLPAEGTGTMTFSIKVNP